MFTLKANTASFSDAWADSLKFQHLNPRISKKAVRTSKKIPTASKNNTNLNE